MFTITSEPARKLIRIKLAGMLTSDQVADLYRQEHRAIDAMGCRIGEHLCNVDLTECPLQLQDVVAAFQREIQARPQARRLAVFTGQALARMQARRILRRPDVAIFVTQQEARGWLFSEVLGKAA
jgi:hypothetical protein